MTEKLLKPMEVMAHLRVCRSTFYNTIRTDPTFPDAIYLGPKMPRWRESDIIAWCEAKRASSSPLEAA